MAYCTAQTLRVFRQNKVDEMRALWRCGAMPPIYVLFIDVLAVVCSTELFAVPVDGINHIGSTYKLFTCVQNHCNELKRETKNATLII